MCRRRIESLTSQDFFEAESCGPSTATLRELCGKQKRSVGAMALVSLPTATPTTGTGIGKTRTARRSVATAGAGTATTAPRDAGLAITRHCAMFPACHPRRRRRCRLRRPEATRRRRRNHRLPRHHRLHRRPRPHRRRPHHRRPRHHHLRGRLSQRRSFQAGAPSRLRWPPRPRVTSWSLQAASTPEAATMCLTPAGRRSRSVRRSRGRRPSMGRAHGVWCAPRADPWSSRAW